MFYFQSSVINSLQKTVKAYIVVFFKNMSNELYSNYYLSVNRMQMSIWLQFM